MEMLLAALQSARNKAESQTQQHVRKNRTQDSGTDDRHIRVAVARLEQHHEEHNLDDGTKGGFDNHAEDLGDFTGEFGTSEADHVGGGDHGDVVGDEDGEMPFRACKVLRISLGNLVPIRYMNVCTYQRNGNRNNRPQHVDKHTKLAVALEANLQELERMHTPPAALALGLNALRNLVSIVVEAREMATVPGAIARGVRRDHRLRFGLVASILTRRAAGMAGHIS